MMLLFAGMHERVLEPEVMDDPELDAGRHYRALKGLSRINRLSASSRILWPPLARLARERKVNRLKVLDIATGSGDVPLALWRRARRRGVELEILGTDFSPRAVEYGRRRAEEAGANLRFEMLDVSEQPLPEGYDAVMCSLFLHHLSGAQAVELLRKIAAATRHLLLVNDLQRSRIGLLAAQAVCRLVTTSSVVHFDGPQSVRAAFTIDEARQLAREAGLSDVEIAARWPFRYLMQWSKE